VDYVIVVLLALVSRRVLALQSLSNGHPFPHESTGGYRKVRPRYCLEFVVEFSAVLWHCFWATQRTSSL